MIEYDISFYISHSFIAAGKKGENAWSLQYSMTIDAFSVLVFNTKFCTADFVLWGTNKEVELETVKFFLKPH